MTPALGARIHDKLCRGSTEWDFNLAWLPPASLLLGVSASVRTAVLSADVAKIAYLHFCLV
jgi:hypothetical protein